MVRLYKVSMFIKDGGAMKATAAHGRLITTYEYRAAV
jgi:hypothetical protein